MALTGYIKAKIFQVQYRVISRCYLYARIREYISWYSIKSLFENGNNRLLPCSFLHFTGFCRFVAGKYRYFSSLRFWSKCKPTLLICMKWRTCIALMVAAKFYEPNRPTYYVICQLVLHFHDKTGFRQWIVRVNPPDERDLFPLRRLV